MSLTDYVQFVRGIVRHSPNVYLDELQELLEERCGTKVNEATIWRALSRSGFTMKKVCKVSFRKNLVSSSHS